MRNVFYFYCAGAIFILKLNSFQYIPIFLNVLLLFLSLDWKYLIRIIKYSIDTSGKNFQGVGAAPAATHAAMQIPLALLHASMAAGTPTPPVETPAVPPAAETQATQTALHPV